MTTRDLKRPTAVLKPQSTFQSLERDCTSWLPYSFLSSDFRYLLKRYLAEGDTFLCVTMPLLGKTLESSLSSGEQFIVPLGWKLKKGTRLPLHFYHYFSVVMDDAGLPLPPSKNSPAAVTLLRQVFLYWSKTVSGVTHDEETFIMKFHDRISKPRNTVMESLLQNRETVRSCLDQAKRLMRVIFEQKSRPVQRLHEFRKEPWGRHGPGAVAGKEVAGEKWKFQKWPSTPQRLYQWSDEPLTLKRETVLPSSRTTCVPKDFRGPRIICIEPKEYQFAQQGLMEILYSIVHECFLTKDSINFFDVSESHRLCFNMDYATIDLKDASDNISLSLVKLLFPRWVYRILVRYRTPLIDGKTYQCFSTMGSALCFPVQTLVFWALALGTMISVKDSHRSFGKLPLRLRVFGDDIIVPRCFAESVCDTLTACGLVVNPNKTCIHSLVRESCGEWVYANFSCRILRPRTHTISAYADWITFIDAAEQAKELCLFALSDSLKSQAMKFYTPPSRWCRNLQRREIRVPVLTRARGQQLTGYAGLYAWHVRNTTSPSSRGTRLKVKWKWIMDVPKYHP